MIHPLYPCLWFDGKAKQAADFYSGIFKTARITSENPMVVMLELGGSPGEAGKKVMMLNGGPMYTINPSISYFVTCNTVESINQKWDKLLEGGKSLMTIDKYPWSERYGWVQDKYGMTWQLMLDEKAGSEEKFVPSLLFTGKVFGKAEEAMKLYSSLLDNSKIDAISHYPDGDGNAGKVMFAEFLLNNERLIAMDGPGEHAFSFSEGLSFVLNCDNQQEIDFLWEKLTEGGEESRCGWLKDKFGVSWQIVPIVLPKLMSDPKRSQRVVQAFLKMKKFDIAELEKA